MPLPNKLFKLLALMAVRRSDDVPPASQQPATRTRIPIRRNSRDAGNWTKVHHRKREA